MWSIPIEDYMAGCWHINHRKLQYDRRPSLWGVKIFDCSVICVCLLSCMCLVCAEEATALRRYVCCSPSR